ncbi:hypothetical protein F8153_05720 [Alkaliphilus serpentinus]|uniref:Peptidase C39-like domain-containing protein n=2 Tax=Alkaliphilus serpentinus TaxID=1482731 RepID=A0A833MA02_9FIRM|nr:hypothetical protein F8153_05720 [Alkaliphilus serpentinus]
MVTDYLDPILEVPEAKTTSTNLKRAVIFICLLLIMGQGAFATVYIKGFYKNRAVTDVSGINTVMEKPQTRIFDNKLKGKVNFEVPLIQQYPQLPRGCEVTSLAMLLQYAGIDVDKMTLAREILKDPTPFKRINGKTYFGNPNDGFVGDMYSLKNPGYGVYHGPILKLLEEYMPGQTVNLTGRSFGDLLYFVNKEIPVWVITNTRYKELENNQFQVWETPTGPVKITYRQHAVIITGYDEKYIYINDPLYNGANRKINRSNFEAAWIQMGQQAVSYIPEGEELHSILPPEEQ